MSQFRIPRGEVTSIETRILERNSEYLGVSTLQLMENAGKAIADQVTKRFPRGGHIVVCGGTGRNGGDGMVAARHLSSVGYRVTFVLVGAPYDIGDESTSSNWRAITRMSETIGIEIMRDSSEISIPKCDVIVDALLGTGLRGRLRQPILRAVEVINRTKGFKIAVDVPTGVDSDTGDVLGAAVKADLTVTFHARKPGLRIAKQSCGEVKVAQIGIPSEAWVYAGPGDVEVAVIPRPPKAHKGDFGRVLVVGGSEIYSGAPALVALAALRTGVDLVFVAAPDRVAKAVSSFSPNLITIALSGEHLADRNTETIMNHMRTATCVVVGPGLGTHNETFSAVLKILQMLERFRKPALIDADAIKAIGKAKRSYSFPIVLTPHAGEFQLIAGRSPSDDLQKRSEEVRSVSRSVGGTVLLKGNTDVVSDGVKVRLNRSGNPAMTVGGTGDVLSGIVAGLMAMGNTGFQSSVAGAFINGAAGDLAREEMGDHLAPTDLIHLIPKIMNDPMGHRKLRIAR